MSYQNLKEKIKFNKNDVNNNVQYASGQSGGLLPNLSLELKDDLVENFNLASINASYTGFQGGCYDGDRYIYFITYAGAAYAGYFGRYDTWADHGTSGSYSFLDLTTMSSNYKGFRGCCFDGRYVYLNVYFNGSRGHWWLRYDTTASFATGNITAFDLHGISSNAEGYESICFDGRYIYGIPRYSENYGGFSGYLIRYDTTASFTAAGSYASKDIGAIDASYVGWSSGCFDGRYLYMAAYGDNSSNAYILRYDTIASFTVNGSYEVLDIKSLDTDMMNLGKMCFDGQNIYISSLEDTSNNDYGGVFKYDTTKEFVVSNFEFKDLGSINAAYVYYSDVNFDGRYIYFCPKGVDAAQGNLVVYDTLEDFTEDSSFQIINLASINANYKGYEGTAIVGKHLYLIPYGAAGGTVGNFTRLRIKP